MAGSNRRPYLTATVLDQALLDACADNLECKLELVVEIEAPDGSTIYVSDRNKYVGSRFYEARLNFPTIKRTLGEWLSDVLEFSTLEIEFSNVDGRYNRFMPGGADFNGWVGRAVSIKLGLAEVAASYTEIYAGTVTEIGGFSRNVKTVKLVLHDKFDKVSRNFPTLLFTESAYPYIDDDKIGLGVPVIYGDWSRYLEPNPAVITAIVVNGGSIFVDSTKKLSCIFQTGTPGVVDAPRHKLDADDPIQFETSGTLPVGLSPGITYYVIAPSADSFEVASSPGGASINLGDVGSGQPTAQGEPASAKRNIQCVVSSHDLLALDQDNIYLKRGDFYYRVPTSEIAGVGAGNRTVEILQQTLTPWAAGVPFVYANGDTFWVRVVGKDLGAYTKNAVWQARDLLITYGGVLSGDFNANWTTYRDKASPAQSAISLIASRAHIQESKPLIEYASSLVDQVRLGMFVDRTLKFKLRSLHFEDWEASPSFEVRNWDVVRDTFQPTIDTRNNFNRVQAAFNRLPDKGENARLTPVLRNQNAINQAGGKIIFKDVSFPNLYVPTDVLNQTTEILKLASSVFEIINVTLTWRALLLDVGDFVKVSVDIGSCHYANVPAMIRGITYDPVGLKIVVTLWCFQLVPFPGYTPGFPGTVGGSTATIVQE